MVLSICHTQKIRVYMPLGFKTGKSHKRSFSSRKNEIYNSAPELRYSDAENEHAHGYYMNYIYQICLFACLFLWTKLFILLLLNSHEWFTDVGCEIILLYININQVVIVHVSYTGACSRKNQMLQLGHLVELDPGLDAQQGSTG